ncbi:glycosyltransferase family 39 protein [Desulfococcaceae bacterium HSG9]|nr:glycosyltransferase family 39 protein [Desulfococcaceae bacterium HSG9]
MLIVILHHFLFLTFLSGISFVSVGLGRVALRWFNLKFVSYSELNLFAFSLGCAILSYSIFLLAALQLLYFIIIYILMGVFVVVALVGWLNLSQFRPKWQINAIGAEHLNLPPPSFQDRCFGVILSVCILACFLLVLTPAISNDALTYHLAIPKLFLKHHGFYFIQGNLFAQYPLNSDMLFLIGLTLQGDILAKGIHFVFALFLLAGMYHFSKCYFPRNTFIILPLLIFFTIPSVFINAHTAYTDVMMAFYTFLTVWAYLNWLHREQTVWLGVCGVLTGMAIATKYAGLLMLLIGCLGVLWGGRHHRMAYRKAFRLLLIYIALVLLIGCPFYIKNWIMAGNPLYPFFFNMFGGKGWSIEQARYFDYFHHNLGMGRGLKDYLLLPWNLSFHAEINSARFDGILGPVFILTLPFAISLRKIPQSIKIITVYCIFTFIFWASAVQQIRYLIPIFPFLAIMVGYLLNDYQKKAVIFTFLILSVSFSLTFNGFYIIKNFNKIKPSGVISGAENRDAFLARMIPSYTMFRYLNRTLPGDSKIFFIYMKNIGYLCDRSYYSDSMFESYTIQKILSRTTTLAEMHRTLKARGFTHILYDINYVFRNLSTFSKNEKERFADFQEKYLSLVKTTKQRYYLYKLSDNLPVLK